MEKFLTNRPTVVNLESMLEKEIPLLNKGFIRVIDYMGDDSAIVQAARVSYGKGTKTLQNDESLIRYLLKHKHTTPFEMCELKLHIKAPIFVARQWLRHRTASVNEYSARYSEMENDFYVPNIEQIATQSSSNKQGRGELFSEAEAEHIIKEIKDTSNNAFSVYENFLGKNTTQENSKILAKEIARTILPVNFYTQFYWKIDLHNLLHFLKLRVHSHAQYEIRVYAEAILNIVKEWVPIVYKAFVDYQQDSVSLSNSEVKLLQYLIKNKKSLKDIDLKEYNISSRELNELISIFNL
jgi:thymidylate synthase (FAD)